MGKADFFAALSAPAAAMEGAAPAAARGARDEPPPALKAVKRKRAADERTPPRAAPAAGKRMQLQQAQHVLRGADSCGGPAAQPSRLALATGSQAPLLHSSPAAPRPAVSPASCVGGSKARVRQQKLHSGVLLPPAPASAAAAPDAPLTKRQKLMQSVHLPARLPVTPAAKCELSFASDWHDHCETPFEAYRDVEPLLFQLALRVKRTKATLRIYDPYYCEGSMVTHLARLGFESVYNRNEDCYAAWEAQRVPEYDVLVTNPPYSADHMQRCLAYAVSCGKPWLLLLPSFVCRKRSYAPIVAALPEPPAYLVPTKRYVYFAPGRQTDATQPTSPFDSMWYMSLAGGGASEPAAPLLSWWERKYAKATGLQLARTVDALPAELTPVRDEKRANPKARRRAQKRAAFLHKEFGIKHAHVRDKKKS